MKEFLLKNAELKAFGTVIAGMIDLYGLVFFAIGIIVGHFISPFTSKFIQKVYERKTKGRAYAHRKIS